MKRLWCKKCRRYFRIPDPPKNKDRRREFENAVSILHQFVAEGYCCKCKEPAGETKVKRKRYWWYEIFAREDDEWWLVGGRNTKGEAFKLAKLIMLEKGLEKKHIAVERCWKEAESVEFT